MPGETFLKQTNGGLVETIATQVGGAPNADKIPALDANGRLDVTMMPSGIGADTNTVTASEALAAGDLVNVYNLAGNARVRKADATSPGKEANGFVIAAVANGATATVYSEGTNGQVSGLTPGQQFLSTTPGLATSVAPSASGNVLQRVGMAFSATSLNFESGIPITLA